MSAPYVDTVITGNDAGTFADRRPLMLAVLGAASISASGVLIKLADTGTATAAFYRCLLALPLLIALAVLERRRRGPRPAAGRRWAFVAGLSLAVDLVLWNHAIAEVGAGVATVLGNLQVLFVAFAAWALFKERPERKFLAFLPVVMVGVVMVSGMVGGDGGGTHPLAGIIYGLGTSIAYTAFLLTLRRTSGSTPHVVGPLAEVTTGAAAGALLLGLVFGGLQLRIGWPTFGWLLLLALLSQTLGWLLITSSLPRLPAAISSLTLLLQPAAAMLLAFGVLGERPTLIQIAGAVIVCTGVVTISLTTSRQPGQPGPAGPSRLAEAPALPRNPVAAADRG
jgi:drug/metabolite transporter (DMT)-like permease